MDVDLAKLTVDVAKVKPVIVPLLPEGDLDTVFLQMR